MFSFAFCFVVLHILSNFIIVAVFHHRFVVNARVGDDHPHCIGLLNALTILVALCWTVSVMRWLMVWMSFSSCSVSKMFLNSRWNSIFVGPIYVISTPLDGLLCINMFLNRLMTVTSVMISGVFVVNFGLPDSVSAFRCPSPLCLLLKYGIRDFVLSCCFLF